jgi:hypothetical protein
MKVALILTGYMRKWKTTYTKYKKFIIDKYNPDIFISSYTYSQDTLNDEFEQVDANEVLEYYKPKEYLFRDTETCPNNFVYKEKNYGILGQTWIERQRRGWYTNKLSLNLFDPKQYEVIIKARPENPVKNLLLTNKNLVIPAWKVHPGPCDPKKSLFDRFAYGNAEYMEKYLNLYDYMQKMYDDSIDISLGETLMYDYVKNYIGLNNLHLDKDIDWYIPTSEPKWASEQRTFYEKIEPKLVV